MMEECKLDFLFRIKSYNYAKPSYWDMEAVHSPSFQLDLK